MAWSAEIPRELTQQLRKAREEGEQGMNAPSQEPMVGRLLHEQQRIVLVLQERLSELAMRLEGSVLRHETGSELVNPPQGDEFVGVCSLGRDIRETSAQLSIFVCAIDNILSRLEV